MRTAIGRSAGDEPSVPPPVLLRVPEIGLPARIDLFRDALEKLGGSVHEAASPEEVLDILDAEGIPLEPPKMMNLALFREKGGDDNGYEVKRLVDPQTYRIDVRGIVLQELGAA